MDAKVMRLGKTSGQMTDIQFMRKSKAEPCHPCTSHAFYIAQKEKEEWGGWMTVSACSVMESVVKMMSFGKTSGQVTDNENWRKCE
jgi:hypothetical protein